MTMPNTAQNTVSSVPDLLHMPPHSIAAEQAVLGAMLLGDKVAVEEAADILKPADFYRVAHETIFTAILILSEKGEPVDLVTLPEELRRTENLERVGGMDFIIGLTDAEFTTAHVGHYARIVRDKAVKRGLLNAAYEIAKDAFRDEDPADDLREKAEKAIFSVGTAKSGENFQLLREGVKAEMDAIEKRAHHTGDVMGVDTGFTELNTMTGGYQPGDFIIVAARPSMGKTSKEIQEAMAASSGGAVAFFSLEMSKEQVVQRILCSEARVNAMKLRTGELETGEWQRLSEAAKRLWDAGLYIDDQTSISVADIRSRCRRLQARQGLDLVVVDYLQLLAPPPSGRGGWENKNVEITETAKGLKNIAREFKVPVVALSQLSRAVEKREDKRPMLSDLRDSGGLEAEADMVQFIYRPAYYQRKEAREQGVRPYTDGSEDAIGEEAEVIIAKQRNGPTGVVKLRFMPAFAKFADLETRGF